MDGAVFIPLIEPFHERLKADPKLIYSAAQESRRHKTQVFTEDYANGVIR